MPLARKKLVEGLEYFGINFRTQLFFQRFLCLRVVDFRILNHVPVGDEVAVVPEQEAAAGGRQVRISELDGLPSEIRLNLHGDQAKTTAGLSSSVRFSSGVSWVPPLDETERKATN